MEQIEIDCREEVIRQGGAVSHHHGIGKMKKRFMEKVYPKQMLEYFNNTKKFYDPYNIFAGNNTAYRDAEEEELERKGFKNLKPVFKD